MLISGIDDFRELPVINLRLFSLHQKWNLVISIHIHPPVQLTNYQSTTVAVFRNVLKLFLIFVPVPTLFRTLIHRSVV